ncbi:MAG: ComF family protein [Gallionella sp.]
MSHHGLWCEACEAAMPYLNTPHCPLCALPTTQGECCGHCLRSPPLFNRTIAVFAYRFPLDKLIQAMKYQEQLALSQTFAEKILPRIKPLNLPDYLIAMPLHPEKLRRRGYNQAQLIAAKIAHKIKRPLLRNGCHRLRDTPSQASLPWPLRHKNMRDAFSCDTDLTGKHIALVDDVFTTGASLNALAVAVKKQGATEISAWVIARTLPHDP